MAADPMLGDGSRNALAAILFMQSVMTTLDAFSTFQSSPWTIENFGADPVKVKACKEYLAHAVGFSLGYAVIGTVIARSPWPILGSVASNTYLVWLYYRAMNRGAQAGSDGWANSPESDGPHLSY
jgi:hypothetical protein